MSKGLEARAHALEGVFFAKQDQELLEGLRQKRQGEDLARATGIDDADTIALLIGAGIRVETLVALLLAPMVEIAWADGLVTPLERNTFHADLANAGIRPSSPAGRILERWLEQGPPDGLMDAWSRYVEALSGTMDTAAFAQLGDTVVRLCRSEADADGGVLRIGRRVSAAEAAILEAVEAAFDLV